jgi:hypothetical protein
MLDRAPTVLPVDFSRALRFSAQRPRKYLIYNENCAPDDISSISSACVRRQFYKCGPTTVDILKVAKDEADAVRGLVVRLPDPAAY